jgi:hypothetical protein
VDQFEFVLKGHGFSRAVTAAKSIAALRFAEKLDVALDFGWRGAGVPSTRGFGVMGWSGSPLR